MTAYDAYIDSGIDFLGKLPYSWQVTRIANVFEERNIVDNPAEELLSIDRHRGIIKQSETGRKIRAPQDRNSYKLIEPGQLGYNILNAFMGAIGISRYRGIISPAYAVARFRKEQAPWYFHYLLRTLLYQQQFNRFSYGIMYERNRMYFDRFKTIPIPVPPLAEQEKIAHYLCTQDAKIARFIRIKRELIARLNEQKLRLIDHAVTGGLDTSTQRKPSGVAWLGDVPGHWETKPLKRWVHINACALGETTTPDFTFRYVDIGSVQTGRLVKNLERIRFSNAPSRARRLLRRGDTIISTVRTYLKAIWYVDEEASDLIASTGFAVLTPGKYVVPEYLGYVIQSSGFVNQVTANSIGIAYPAIAETVLGRFSVALPPIDEQHTLLAHIKTQTAPINRAITQSEQEITLIREYRERLIQDAVTGQIDLRGWQPSADDPISDDELAALADPDTTRLDEEETSESI